MRLFQERVELCEIEAEKRGLGTEGFQTSQRLVLRCWKSLIFFAVRSSTHCSAACVTQRSTKRRRSR
jgi:hypothetical protein